MNELPEVKTTAMGNMQDPSEAETRQNKQKNTKSEAGKGGDHCCQLAFFNARFHKTGIFQKRLALKIFYFIYCLALKFYLLYLLFGI